MTLPATVHHRRRVVALTGVAVAPALWDGVRGHLDDDTELIAPSRPRSGSLETELAFLQPLVRGAVVVGVSGGATLALALAARVPLAGAVAHEPAVGSLLPGLLAPMRAAFADGGTRAFAARLYGSSWLPQHADTLEDDLTARELAMFAAFEPAPLLPDQGAFVVTTGELSPAVRHRAAAALAGALGVTTVVLPGTGHFAQLENPLGLADVVRDLLDAQP